MICLFRENYFTLYRNYSLWNDDLWLGRTYSTSAIIYINNGMRKHASKIYTRHIKKHRGAKDSVSATRRYRCSRFLVCSTWTRLEVQRDLITLQPPPLRLESFFSHRDDYMRDTATPLRIQKTIYFLSQYNVVWALCRSIIIIRFICIILSIYID